MNFVFIYPASGRFTGGEFKWDSPSDDSMRDFMLFLRQSQDVPTERAALAEIRRFGFTDVRLMSEGKQIDVESLNDAKLAPFRRNYEGALAAGASLAWYA